MTIEGDEAERQEGHRRLISLRVAAQERLGNWHVTDPTLQ